MCEKSWQTHVLTSIVFRARVLEAGLGAYVSHIQSSCAKRTNGTKRAQFKYEAEQYQKTPGWSLPTAERRPLKSSLRLQTNKPTVAVVAEGMFRGGPEREQLQQQQQRL